MPPSAASSGRGDDGMGLKVVVDFDLCEANARCMEVCPEVFKVDDDDFLHVLDENPPEALRAKLKEAERVCPRQAITIVES
jgi:ferredoxin